MKRAGLRGSIPRMNDRGAVKPVFFCCGCAAALALAITAVIIIAAFYWMEIVLAYIGAGLEDGPLDIPVREVSEAEVKGIESKITAHLQAAAQGEAEDLILGPEEFELLVASAFCEGQTPAEISSFHVTAEEDKLRVQFSHEMKEGKYLNIDFTGGVAVADGRLSVHFASCKVGGKEVEQEDLDKLSKALVEGIDKNPKAAEAVSAFEKLETSGGKLRIRLSPEAAKKFLKQKKEPEPEPAGAEV